jgi:lipid II:glycine glycyltransferase (peptidoglycan interpeptide bridge formation enzyme)
MYKETIPFKDHKAMEESLSHVKQLIQNSILSGTGKMWFAKDKMGKPLSGVFIQEFSNTLYYQFGASSAHNLKVSPNALILLKIIENAFQNNFDSLDFVGMNSPKRGAFKASFNPKPKLYFQVMIE